MISTVRFAASLTAAALILAPIHAAQADTVPTGTTAASPRNLTQTVSPEAVGFDANRLARLEASMKGVVDQGRVAGLTMLLARHGKIVSYKTYGQRSIARGQPMTTDTIFRIYSMTKPVTGVAMMILFEEGKWRLDDPVTRFIPEFKDLKVETGLDSQGRPIVEDIKHIPTMREIMSHTAGFSHALWDPHPVGNLYREKGIREARGYKDFIDRLAPLPLVYQPGTAWRYSLSVDIQGAIIERITGMTFGEFLQKRIFAPLKMTDTGFYLTPEKANRLSGIYERSAETGKLQEATKLLDYPIFSYLTPPGLESGSNGLASTAIDYARFAQMLANKGELDGVRILSPAAVELMGTNVLPRNVLVSSNGIGFVRFSEAIGFGLDVMVVMDPRAAGSLEGKGTYSWGGAAGTWFWVDPENDLTFVLMTQRSGGANEGDELSGLARTLTYQALTHPER